MTKPNSLLSIVLPLAGLLGSLTLAAEANEPIVRVDVRVIQLNEPTPAPTHDDDGAATTREAPAENVAEPQVLATTPDGLTVLVADADRKLKLAGRTWSPPTDDDVPRQRKTGQQQAESVIWTTLTAPRLTCQVGQEACITVGEAVPYLVKRDDGSLVLERLEAVEGITIRVLVDTADKDSVTFKTLRIKITQLIGREPIPDVPFDVGRPIVRSVEASAALRLGTEKLAIIALPVTHPGDRPIFVLLRAKPQETKRSE